MHEATVTSSFFLPTVSLWRREVVTFARQRSRVLGALGAPLLFWVLIGSGFGDSFRISGAGTGLTGGTTSTINYLEYSFPGAVVLISLFTAIFATMSVIEDRQTGFLQAVLAAPVRRSAIVMGKLLGSTTLALIQASLLLMLAPLAGFPMGLGSILATIGVVVMVSLGLSALGLWLAWRIDSMQGFHAVVNLILLPMWLMSGAAFPADGASRWVGWVMSVNPVTYGVAAMRQALYLGSPGPGYQLPSLALSMFVTTLFTAAMIALACHAVGRKV